MELQRVDKKIIVDFISEGGVNQDFTETKYAYIFKYKIGGVDPKLYSVAIQSNGHSNQSNGSSIYLQLQLILWVLHNHH